MISVKSDLASAAVILAYPSFSEDELREKLKEFSSMGYDVQHFISPGDFPRGYSAGFESMIARLENHGYISTGSFGNLGSLNENGLAFLEKIILTAFAENPELTQRFALDVGLNLTPILHDSVKKFLQLSQSP